MKAYRIFIIVLFLAALVYTSATDPEPIPEERIAMTTTPQGANR